MADTTYVDGSTLLTADTMNDLNRLHYTIFGDPADDAAARTGIGLGTADTPQFTGINLGHASDTTITRASAGVIAVEGSNVVVSGGALGTPASGTLTNCTGLPQAGVTGLTTADSPQFTGINLGHASDTTITRVSAGVIAVEGSPVLLDSGLGVTVQEYDANTLKSNVTAALSTGYSFTPYDRGPMFSGTYTVNEDGGGMQYVTNNGAFTLAPPTNSTSVVVLMTNSGAAGVVTTSGFTKVTGDAITTTSAHKFLFFITNLNGSSLLDVKAMQ